MKQSFCTQSSIVMADDFSVNQYFQQVLSGDTLLRPVSYDEDITGYANKIVSSFWSQLADKYSEVRSKCALLCIESISRCGFDPQDPNQLIIVSTTKGDIDLLTEDSFRQTEPPFLLAHIGKQIQKYFKTKVPVLTISNACISGSQAIMMADGYIKSSLYSTVYVVGVDLFTDFTFSGFYSFKAISDVPCRPFDLERKGISLGEGAACIRISSEQDSFAENAQIVLKAAALTNDANHISGPSRDGSGLFQAIQTCMKKNRKLPDIINLHGTGTLFNDDMEAIAIHRAGLSDTPTFGLKGYCGHTLGAAGIIESILTLSAMVANICPPTIGFQHSGTQFHLNISDQERKIPCNVAWKSTSGFGGGNCLLVFEKN
jgi:3-oxoacyl-[acyl-carrier-protein] synthase-1